MVRWRTAGITACNARPIERRCKHIGIRLEQALTAQTETQQRWQLTQLRGLLLTLPSSNLSLEDSLRRLIRSCGPRWLSGNRTAAVPLKDRLLEAE